jgi:hypothetical protein
MSKKAGLTFTTAAIVKFKNTKAVPSKKRNTLRFFKAGADRPEQRLIESVTRVAEGDVAKAKKDLVRFVAEKAANRKKPAPTTAPAEAAASRPPEGALQGGGAQAGTPTAPEAAPEQPTPPTTTDGATCCGSPAPEPPAPSAEPPAAQPTPPPAEQPAAPPAQ